MGVYESRERKIGKTTLEQIRETISIKATELQSANEKLAETLKIKEESEKSISENAIKISEQESKIKILQKEESRLIDEHRSLTQSSSLQEQEIGQNFKIIAGQKSDIEKYTLEISEYVRRKNVSEAEYESVRLATSKAQEELEDLEDEIDKSLSLLENYQLKIAELIQMQDDVNNAITTAMENFSIFEQRIHQFSEDTGYIVGYKNPKDLIKTL